MAIVQRTFSAEERIKDALDWSIEHHGEEGNRYAALILQAEEDLAENPGRRGVQALDGGVLRYHLRYSAKRAPTTPKVKNPVHSLIARTLPDGSQC